MDDAKSSESRPKNELRKAAACRGVRFWISSLRLFGKPRRSIASPAAVVAVGLSLSAFVMLLAATGYKLLADICWVCSNVSETSVDSSHLSLILFLTAVVVVFALWWLPKRQAVRSPGLTKENHFDRENEARKTLAQIIGGIFVLAGLYSSVQTFNLQRKSGDDQRQGQITDRFTKAIDQLGSLAPGDKSDESGRPRINLDVRLGGIYALERIARDSERDHWPIMEVLTSYVRENSEDASQLGKVSSKQGETDRSLREMPRSDQHLRMDVQAAVTVVGRRNTKFDPPSVGVNLSRSILVGADMYKAELSGAHFEEAHLEWAQLQQAHLEGAYLTEAHLLSADMTDAKMNGAILSGAHLEDADLSGTDLSGAHFEGTDLSGADLYSAVGLTKSQLILAIGNEKTSLPIGINTPDSWIK